MKYAVLSSFNHARRVYLRIQSSNEDSVVAFVVEQQEKWGKEIYGTRIISTGRALEYYKNRKFDKFLIPSMSEDINERMYGFLKDMDVPDKDILYADKEFIFGNRDCTGLPMYINRNELDTIEFHVADCCNLNCKYCSMFSPLSETYSFPDIEVYYRDLLQLKNYFHSIKRIKLLGGEPLLNPDLGEFVLVTRKVFPYTDIIIITNGLLLRKMNSKFYTILQQSGVELVVSYYPPMSARIEELHNFLEEKSIQHRITSLITYFYKIYDLSGKQDRVQNFNDCNCKIGCATLRDGYLYTCFVPSVIGIAKDELGLRINVDDGINLYKQGLCSNQIRELLLTPPQSCKYCLPKGVRHKWEPVGNTNPKTYDYWSI